MVEWNREEQMNGRKKNERENKVTSPTHQRLCFSTKICMRALTYYPQSNMPWTIKTFTPPLPILAKLQNLRLEGAVMTISLEGRLMKNWVTCGYRS